MHLEQIRLNFEKRHGSTGLQATLQPGATEAALQATEDRLGCRLPDQVRTFYLQHNGLSVDNPRFEILSMSDLILDNRLLIHFATADGTARICFDCSRYNEAGQWDIVESETGTRITYTMGSFWTIKMWKWIDRRVRFWQGEV